MSDTLLKDPPSVRWFLVLLAAILAFLRLIGANHWSWWAVSTPLWIPALWTVLGYTTFGSINQWQKLLDRRRPRKDQGDHRYEDHH